MKNIVNDSAPSLSLPRRQFGSGHLLNVGKKLLALAFNHAAERCIAIGLATNVSNILGDEEWQPLSDYSENPYWREENGQWKKYRQVLTRPQAEKMVAAINAKRAKQGNHFRGLPIYRGHPDADPKQWPDDRRFGGVMELEAREDALYAKLAWNDLGQKNKEQGYYIYPSPAWLFDESEAQSRGIIAPDVLQSVGLTNTPRIPSSKPWTNTDPGSQFSANNPISPEGGNNPNNKQKEKTPMPKWLIEKLIALGVLQKPADGSEPTEEQLRTAVSKLAVNSDPMEIALGQKKISVIIAGDNRDSFLTEVGALATNAETATTKATKATEEADKFRGLAINALLDAGKITAAQKIDLEKLDGAAFETKIAEFKTVALNTRKLPELQPNQSDLSTPQGRSLAFNARVNAIMAAAEGKGRKISIDDAITEMRANADDAALLKAMEPAATK